MSKKAFELSASIRSTVGKGASRRLRRLENNLPGIIYGGDGEPQMLTLSHREVAKVLENEAFYSHILTINVDGDKQQAVLKDLQRHPYKPFILHMDFLRVTGKEAIVMNVPLHFVGGDTAPGVKAGGVISHMINELEIKCLPKDLPEYINVDVSHLKLDETVHLTDIKLPSGVVLNVPITEGHDSPIANIHIPRVIEEEEPVAEEAESKEGAEEKPEGEEGAASGEEADKE